MSQLVDKLKKDHSDLVGVLEDVKKLGIKNPEGVKKLNSAKAALLAHLKLEDTQLYPSLFKAAEKDSNLKSTLSVLAKDMELVSKAALDFFNKYEKGGDEMEFVKDYAKFISALGTRVRREESTLYTEFDKISTNKAA